MKKYQYKYMHSITIRTCKAKGNFGETRINSIDSSNPQILIQMENLIVITANETRLPTEIISYSNNNTKMCSGQCLGKVKCRKQEKVMQKPNSWTLYSLCPSS